MLKRTMIGLMCLLWLIALPPFDSLADDLFIYPTKNQSAEQQDKDKWECRAWATKQTGFDPAARATATAPPTREAPRGGLVRGAAGGAALGAVGGAIAGNAGKGAAIGAAGGGLLGVMRRNDQVRAGAVCTSTMGSAERGSVRAEPIQLGPRGESLSHRTRIHGSVV